MLKIFRFRYVVVVVFVFVDKYLRVCLISWAWYRFFEIWEVGYWVGCLVLFRAVWGCCVGFSVDV